MAFKFIAVIALAAFVNAGHIAYEPAYDHGHIHGGPVHYVAAAPVHIVKHIDNHDDLSVPQPYDFKYGVHDSHTGDVKHQEETSDGHGKVHGSYSVIDPDGFKRTVHYTADDHNGFNAVVHREPIGHKIVAAAPVHVAHHAPEVHYVAAAPHHHAHGYEHGYHH
ncbi:larval cuticle protein A2B-like [Condylostylus longicornis]|uniref:larval cuticle protein A2B-like n=1 Tax=Condylostylus longicornis TaxID=2530218 RepID=UPI00244E356F|nr:larval cuticle protein A2B-like [Condylostylus longicornis]